MEKLEGLTKEQGLYNTDVAHISDAVADAPEGLAGSSPKTGQTYGYNDQELIRQLTKSRMEQKQPLEYEDLDGYELPPRSQFSMLKKPAVSIKYGKLTFNMACIRMFEGVQYILPLCHPRKKRLTVVMCREEEAASVDWARVRQKDGVWVNKDISSPEYVDKLYKMMGWNRECRYKVLGRVANSREGLVLVFDLEEAVMFESRSLKVVDEETGQTKEKKKQVAYYPEMYKDRIGKTYNDYASCRQINMFEYLEEYVGNTYGDYSSLSKYDQKEQSAVLHPDKNDGLLADVAGKENPGSVVDVTGKENPTGDIPAFTADGNSQQEDKGVIAPVQTGASFDGQISFELNPATAEEDGVPAEDVEEHLPEVRQHENAGIQAGEKETVHEDRKASLKDEGNVGEKSYLNADDVLQPKIAQNYNRDVLISGINNREPNVAAERSEGISGSMAATPTRELILSGF